MIRGFFFEAGRGWNWQPFKLSSTAQGVDAARQAKQVTGSVWPVVKDLPLVEFKYQFEAQRRHLADQ